MKSPTRLPQSCDEMVALPYDPTKLEFLSTVGACILQIVATVLSFSSGFEAGATSSAKDVGTYCVVLYLSMVLSIEVHELFSLLGVIFSTEYPSLYYAELILLCTQLYLVHENGIVFILTLTELVLFVTKVSEAAYEQYKDDKLSRQPRLPGSKRGEEQSKRTCKGICLEDASQCVFKVPWLCSAVLIVIYTAILVIPLFVMHTAFFIVFPYLYAMRTYDILTGNPWVYFEVPCFSYSSCCVAQVDKIERTQV